MTLRVMGPYKPLEEESRDARETRTSVKKKTSVGKAARSQSVPLLHLLYLPVAQDHLSPKRLVRVGGLQKGNGKISSLKKRKLKKSLTKSTSQTLPHLQTQRTLIA